MAPHSRESYFAGEDFLEGLCHAPALDDPVCGREERSKYPQQQSATMMRNVSFLVLVVTAVDMAAQRGVPQSSPLVETTLGRLTGGVSTLADAKRIYGDSLRNVRGMYVVGFGRGCEL